MIKGYIHINDDKSHEPFVTINAKYLDPKESQDVINHSPDGFQWGYGGSGPAQLALAILLRFCSKEEAVRLHHAFKWDVIAKLPRGKEWQIPNQRVVDWLEAIRGKGARS